MQSTTSKEVLTYIRNKVLNQKNVLSIQNVQELGNYIHVRANLDEYEIVNLKLVLQKSKRGLEDVRFVNALEVKSNPAEQILLKEEAVEIVNDFAGFQVLNKENTLHKYVYYSLEDGLLFSIMLHDPVSQLKGSRVWLLGMDGQILHSYSTNHQDSALVYPENQSPAFGTKPPETTISSISTNGSLNAVSGKDFYSSNTCFAYKCANSSTGTCDISSSICVDVKPEMTEGIDYFTSTYYFAVDGREIDFFYDWQANGYINNTVIMAWTNAPVAASRLYKPANQIWGSDLAWENYAGNEQNDPIVELQVYYYLDKHAAFIRTLLNDSSFCFIGSGPNCTLSDGSDLLNSSSLPIYFFTNYQQLQPFPDQSSRFDDFLTQIFNNGSGKNISAPVKFDQHAFYADAFFQPMPYFPDNLKNCANAGCIDQSTFSYTRMVFGQATTDWGLNECIVYHELTHALVYQYIPLLPSHTWADTGLRSDPGAMNEAWADYFAAIHCGISNFKDKTYNKRPGRNLNNDLTCQNSVGEVHVDSQIFSGALWQIRLALKSEADRFAFDQLILRSISLGHASDLFATQFQIVLDLLSKDEQLSYIVQLALQIFSYREFNCERIQIIEEKSDVTFQLPSNLITVINISTLPTQLKFLPRKSDWAASFRWRQWSISGWLGRTDLGFAKMPLQALISTCPIRVNGTNFTNIKAFSNCSNTLTELEWQNSKYLNLFGSIDFDILPDSSPIYMVIGSTLPQPIIMYSSALTFYGYNHIWRITLIVFSGFYLILFLVASGTFIKTLIQKRKDLSKKIGFFILLFLLYTIPGIFGLFGIIFGIIREIFTICMFGVLFMDLLLSIFFIPMRFNSKLASKLPPVPFLISKCFKVDSLVENKWFLIVSTIFMIEVIVSFLLVISYTSTVLAHSIFYTLFIFLALLHLSFIICSFLNVVFSDSLQVRDAVIPLENVNIPTPAEL